jgi:hypothetical protein
MAYPQKPPNTFTDFGEPTTTEEGPVRTRNITRKRMQRKSKRKRRREARAS